MNNRIQVIRENGPVEGAIEVANGRLALAGIANGQGKAGGSRSAHLPPVSWIGKKATAIFVHNGDVIDYTSKVDVSAVYLERQADLQP